MTREQMIFRIATREVVDAIGESDARAIFDSLMNRRRPEARLFFRFSELANAIDRDEAEAIFYELMSY